MKQGQLNLCMNNHGHGETADMEWRGQTINNAQELAEPNPHAVQESTVI